MSVAQLQDPSGAAGFDCTNCGESGVRRYCPSCGESRPGAGDLAITHFFGHAFHELVHIDSKIFRSFLYLLSKPGFLTLEYFGGRKTRYISPLRIFLTLFAVSLIAYSIYQPLSVWDFGRMVESDQTGSLAPKLADAASKRGMTTEVLYARVTDSWHKWMGRLQFVNVFIAALALQLLYWRRDRYFVEHLVFSLHLQSAFLLLALLTWPIWFVVGFDHMNPRWEMVALTSIISLAITILAVRTYYRQSTVKNVVKGVGLYVVSYVSSVVVTLGSMIVALIAVLKQG